MADTATDTQDPKAPEEEVKDEAEEKKAEPVEPRAIDYILLKHMGRHRSTHTLRAVRPGRRRHRFMLNDGTRIRRKGRQRFTEVSYKLMLESLTQILEGIVTGFIQVYQPGSAEPMGLREFESFVGEVEDKLGQDAIVDYEVLRGVEDLLPLHEINIPKRPPPAEPLEDDQDDGEETQEESPPKGSPTEVTQQGVDLSGIAAADQAKAEAAGEANEPPSLREEVLLEDEVKEGQEEGQEEGQDQEEEEGQEEEKGQGEEEGYTKAELLKMKRKQLNEIASKQFEIKNADKLPSIPSVVDAIMKAGTEK